MPTTSEFTELVQLHNEKNAALRCRVLASSSVVRRCGGPDRRRSGDLALFRRALCQLSYPAVLKAVLTGFEPAASALTGRRALQTAPQDQIFLHPQGDSTPCYRRERAAS